MNPVIATICHHHQYGWLILGADNPPELSDLLAELRRVTDDSLVSVVFVYSDVAMITANMLYSKSALSEAQDADAKRIASEICDLILPSLRARATAGGGA